MDVFEDELKMLHKAGFVHREIKRPSDAGGFAFDNVFLTSEGLQLIDMGISALKTQVGDKLFNYYIEQELKEVALFKDFFLTR